MIPVQEIVDSLKGKRLSGADASKLSDMAAIAGRGDSEQLITGLSFRSAFLAAPETVKNYVRESARRLYSVDCYLVPNDCVGALVVTGIQLEVAQHLL